MCALWAEANLRTRRNLWWVPFNQRYSSDKLRVMKFGTEGQGATHRAHVSGHDFASCALQTPEMAH